ncbi:MAG: hypothetical protein RXO36_03245 [Candidatus Nanopusillus acidilobi]
MKETSKIIINTMVSRMIPGGRKNIRTMVFELYRRSVDIEDMI